MTTKYLKHHRGIIYSILPVILIILLLCPASLACLSDVQSFSEEVLNLWDTGPITLDPAVSSELSSHNYIMQIFSGLVRLDNDLEPSPDIARNWDISNDGRTYTFYLNENVKFHDGSPITAREIQYSWERACNPSTGSQTAGTYLGDIVGVTEVLEGKTDQISGLEIIDDYTLSVTIDAPKAYFLAKLSYPTTFVVDRKNVSKGQTWWEKPNGSGPYKLKQWERDNTLILEANKDFYRQIPHISEIHFHLLAGQPISLYEMNEIDVAPVYEYNIERASDPGGPFHDQLAVFPELSLYYIGFNTKNPPFDDPDIRKAFCLAVNKQKIISVIQKEMVTKANGILPPGLPGYNEGLAGLDYDPDQAHQLIADSTYGSVDSLPPMTITTSGWGGNISASLGAIIQEWHTNLGIEVTVKQLEPEIFLYHLREEADEMFMLGWVADYPDPQNFLENLFQTNSSYNTGDYSNPVVDNLLKAAAIEPDYKTRMNKYQEIEEIVLDDAACLPLWFSVNYMLVKPYVKNFSMNAMGIANYSEAYIER